ncbi:high-affinity glucose transporter RGT2 [Phakopsora pachyrhizi]|uniref:High-affinity glucose transporter RGT2 n=1 Tax=Phakopsora pachyrhizi TaxID=170000 RepID=A0AAV0BDQ1_PHAPC|nr:high-affinity glucose transporter RGT2 [Phakopsora pachyrhizi]CAH7684484.1 high-affinity glucose transporter RGT2 [Phakopsora pachyrhizi]
MSIKRANAPASITNYDAPMDSHAKLVAIAMALFAAFGGFLYGYDTGYISGTKEMGYWLRLFGEQQSDGSYGLSTASDALVTSILSVGTFTGALLAYPFGDFLGRRWGVIASCAIFSIGVALQTASTTVPVFSVGRVFAGLGVGLISCLVPMYQSECAPKWIRGAIVSCYQWAITIGLLVAAIVVQLTKDIDNPNSYRIPIGIQFVWAFILSMGLYFLPESPKYLILKGREQEAKVSLGRLLSLPPHSDFVQKEFEEVNESLQTERIHASSSYMDCFRSGPGKYRLRTLTGMSIQALQQLSGINFIFYFGTSFFRNSGINNAFLTTIITNVVNVLMTIPGIWLVDKAGRRSLLLIGAAVMCICEFIVAIVGVKVDTSNIVGQRVLIAFVCIYIGAFAATWGPIAWVVTSEIYPLSIRAKAMNFAIGYSTPYLVDTGAGKAGLQSKVFFIWGAFCALCFLFTFFFIPETKGLSLEQVDQLYMNSSIIGSNAYRRKLLTGNVRHSSNDSRSVVEDALEEKIVK